MATEDDIGWRAWFRYPDGEIYTVLLTGYTSAVEAAAAAHEEEQDHGAACFKLQIWRRDDDHFCRVCSEPLTS